jgi:hypothetical protein
MNPEKTAVYPGRMENRGEKPPERRYGTRASMFTASAGNPRNEPVPETERKNAEDSPTEPGHESATEEKKER